MHLRSAAGLLLVTLLWSCSQAPPKQKNPLPPSHDDTAEHSLDNLLHESGLIAENPSLKVTQDSNYVVGKLSLDYDENFGPVTRPFRVALAIYTDAGERITDFFEGIPATPQERSFVGTGNAVLRIPSVLVGNSSSKRLAELFPNFIGPEVSLTFKEFSGHAFYLKGVPEGTAFIWFQTDFDGNRITQWPTMIELDPLPGQITRQDIHVPGLHGGFSPRIADGFPFHNL